MPTGQDATNHSGKKYSNSVGIKFFSVVENSYIEQYACYASKSLFRTALSSLIERSAFL